MPRGSGRFGRGTSGCARTGPADLWRAQAHFRRAHDLNARLATAHVGEAEALLQLVEANELAPLDGYTQARESVRRALSADAETAGAIAVDGLLALYLDRDWKRAGERLDRAATLDPNDARIACHRASFLWAAARTDAAVAEYRRAQRLDPSFAAAFVAGGDLLLMLRRHVEAADAYTTATALDPRNPLPHKTLGYALQLGGRKSESVAAYARFKALSDRPSVDLPAHLRQYGHTADVERILTDFSKALNQKYVRPTLVARLYLDLDDTQKALHWLERAYEEHDARLFYLRTDRWWDDIRGEPRFHAVARRLGMG